MEFIVSKLNDSLSLSESLVSFDEKSPVELLQLLSDVFSLLSPVHKRDVRDETPEQTVFRLMDFLLRILYFKVTIDMCVFNLLLVLESTCILYDAVPFFVASYFPAMVQFYAYRASFGPLCLKTSHLSNLLCTHDADTVLSSEMGLPLVTALLSIPFYFGFSNAYPI